MRFPGRAPSDPALTAVTAAADFHRTSLRMSAFYGNNYIMSGSKCQYLRLKRFYSENRNDFWAIIYSTFLLTASLDICDSQAARATAPDGLLPGYQPITDKLTVNRLSRHKVSRLIYDFGSRTGSKKQYMVCRAFSIDNMYCRWYNYIVKCRKEHGCEDMISSKPTGGST